MKTSFALTLAVGLIASGSLGAAHAQQTAQQTQQMQQVQQMQQSQRPSSYSEQVKSDLTDWRAAGFDSHTWDVLSYDVFGPEYQRRYEKYIELRRLHTNQTTQY